MKKILATTIIFAALIAGCRTTEKKLPEQEVKEEIKTNINGKGLTLKIDFEKGKGHNHPLFAIWIEDTLNNYIQTLYVSKSIATSTFNYGEANKGKWMPGVIRRPAALPYWGHQRGIKAPDGLYLPTVEDPVPDAYTGATPQAGFLLISKTDSIPPRFIKVLVEINQSWDWNEYWHNDMYPNDVEYRTSSQPAVVYAAVIDTWQKASTWELKPVGHSHYSGKDGKLYPGLNTLTTALHIAKRITVTLE